MPTNKDEQTVVGLTPAALKDIISTVLAESRKPTELEQLEINERKAKLESQRAQIEADQQARRETAAEQLRIMETKKATQKTCLHEGGRPVHPFTVFINDDLGGFVLCQRCQAVIRPEDARKFYPKNYGGMIIFDTRLFNQCFQKTSDSGVFA